MFSERLEAAIARYHANAITTAQVIEELIQLAKDIGRRGRGEVNFSGLSSKWVRDLELDDAEVAGSSWSPSN